MNTRSSSRKNHRGRTLQREKSKPRTDESWDRSLERRDKELDEKEAAAREEMAEEEEVMKSLLCLD